MYPWNKYPENLLKDIDALKKMTLLEHLDIVWLQAGREITEEMQKYTQQWIEGHLELETANLNSVPRSTS